MSKPVDHSRPLRYTTPSKAYVEALEGALKDAATFLRDSHIPNCGCAFCKKSRELDSVLRRPQRIV